MLAAEEGDELGVRIKRLNILQSNGNRLKYVVLNKYYDALFQEIKEQQLSWQDVITND